MELVDVHLRDRLGRLRQSEARAQGRQDVLLEIGASDVDPGVDLESFELRERPDVDRSERVPLCLHATDRRDRSEIELRERVVRAVQMLERRIAEGERAEAGAVDEEGVQLGVGRRV
jgi:hypothetical protein